MNRLVISNINDQENQISIFTLGTAVPQVERTPKRRQMPLYADIPVGPHLRYVADGLQRPAFLNVRELLENTASTAKPSSLFVLNSLADALEALELLEAVYGYVSDAGCRVVAIVNELSSDQRDSIWDINWDFQAKYPKIDIEIILIQRRGRPLAELFEEGDSADLRREIAVM